MKKIIGWILIAAGIIFGIYVGFWLCFVGGLWTLFQIFTGVIPATFGTFAWAIIRIPLAAFFGYLSGLILVFPGMALTVAD